MSLDASRRQFLRAAGVSGAVAGLGELGFLGQLPRVSAAESKLNPNVVRLHPEIEPLVRLLEETPRQRLLEEVGQRIQRGLSYRELLAALLLAGVRNVEPRPNVGFKFHAVLVVNSAHLASLASPDEHRWLPIFWALDYFKSSQAEDEQQRGWTMAPVDEAAVPPAHKAAKAFVDAMENWDEAAADAAVAGLARSASRNEVYELFFRLGARDFRDIGHKAIYVANSFRTLSCIGWHHAEPVLRSLAYALLQHTGENPARANHDADRPGRENLARIEKIGPNWLDGKADSAATLELLQTLRQGSDKEACQLVVEQLERGVGVQSVWDALFAAAGELVMRQPAIVALHAITTTNALRFAFDTAAEDSTRRWVLLQNAAFLPMFREGMRSRGRVENIQIDRLEPAKLDSSGEEAAQEILTVLGDDRQLAARKTLALVDRVPDPRVLIDAARVLVFLKGTNSHDYKYSSAVFEDYLHLSPEWRDRYLASTVYLLKNATQRDNPLVERTRAALG